jgi:hypothetical protein
MADQQFPFPNLLQFMIDHITPDAIQEQFPIYSEKNARELYYEITEHVPLKEYDECQNQIDELQQSREKERQEMGRSDIHESQIVRLGQQRKETERKMDRIIDSVTPFAKNLLRHPGVFCYFDLYDILLEAFRKDNARVQDRAM